MDPALDALVNLDVPGDIVRIDVRGTLQHSTRVELVHIIRRVRRMGIRCPICVDLSQAALVESSALAGLRSDLNALDINSLPGASRAVVSLQLTDAVYDPAPEASAQRTPLLLEVGVTGLFAASDFAERPWQEPGVLLTDLYGRPLSDYSDKELLAASDSLFALLDIPQALDGADLLGRYNDIGLEILRRQQEPQAPFPAAEGQAAS
ncbi:MAG: hypothetical protein HOQ04_05450 [Pseudarthrobacter sp.]|nr:hypothetical protein [Pseudarthrobacter sp.]